MWRVDHLLNIFAHAHSPARANLPKAILFLCNRPPTLRTSSVSTTMASASVPTKDKIITYIRPVSKKSNMPARISEPLVPSFYPITRASTSANQASLHSSNSSIPAPANKKPSSSTQTRPFSASTAPSSSPPTQVSPVPRPNKSLPPFPRTSAKSVSKSAKKLTGAVTKTPNSNLSHLLRRILL